MFSDTSDCIFMIACIVYELRV